MKSLLSILVLLLLIGAMLVLNATQNSSSSANEEGRDNVVTVKITNVE